MGVLDQLGGDAARTFKFDQPGDRIRGPIKAVKIVQRRNYRTQEPEFWSDGTPVPQIRVVLATEFREDPDDNGERSVYIKGWGDQLADLKQVVKDAGDTDLREGGVFGMMFTGWGEATGGGQPPKTYSFYYSKPANLAGAPGWDQPYQQQPPPQPYQQQPYQQQPPPRTPYQPPPPPPPSRDPWASDPPPPYQQQQPPPPQQPQQQPPPRQQPPWDTAASQPPAAAQLTPEQAAAWRAHQASQAQPQR